jgi:hypothetical protein
MKLEKGSQFYVALCFPFFLHFKSSLQVVCVVVRGGGGGGKDGVSASV